MAEVGLCPKRQCRLDPVSTSLLSITVYTQILKFSNRKSDRDFDRESKRSEQIPSSTVLETGIYPVRPTSVACNLFECVKQTSPFLKQCNSVTVCRCFTKLHTGIIDANKSALGIRVSDATRGNSRATIRSNSLANSRANSPANSKMFYSGISRWSDSSGAARRSERNRLLHLPSSLSGALITEQRTYLSNSTFLCAQIEGHRFGLFRCNASISRWSPLFVTHE